MPDAHASDVATDALSVAERFAQFSRKLRVDTMPPATIDYAKRLLLDAIGCLAVGTRNEPAQRAARAVARLHDRIEGPATDFVTRHRTSARDAAFVNGIALYSVGVNDIHRPSVSHPAGCVVPVLLAVGEWQKKSGAELLPAMAAGYELMGRLGQAMQPSHWDRGFHPTGTFGTFGAAAAASRLLDLSEAETVAALGIAGSQAAGNQAFHTDGSLTMIFHAGRAAQNGVEAAALAAEGFTGPRSVFEDSRGFVAAGADNPKMGTLVEGLGTSLAIDATSFRPYYGCTLTIAASGAMASVLQRHPTYSARDIAGVVVRIHPSALKVIGDPQPRTLLAARLSMEFNVALVIQRGDVLVGDIDEADLWNEELRRLMGLVELRTDPDLTWWGSAVEVRFLDGTADECIVVLPKGDPQNPMSWADTEDKFVRLLASASTAADRAAADAVIDAVHRVEQIGCDELAALIDRLAGSLR